MAGRTSFSWPELECLALAVPSLCNLLRLVEAWTAHINGLGQLVFSCKKSKKGVQVQVPLLQLMGGWCTPAVALSYATPTHASMYESRRRQPVPVWSGGEYKACYGMWTSRHW